jgi:probable rRNA maturation factor
MLAHLGLHDAELSVALVDDATMRALNREWRGKDRSTDVLAFPLCDGEEGSRDLLGDVVIAVPTAARQAARRGRTVLDEMTTLLAHGLLHLLGHDHANAADERKMTALTRELEAAAARPRGRRRAPTVLENT